MALQSFKDLTVWQKSYELTKLVYVIARKLPAYEQYGLANQIKRSAISIPSNIAEGQQRNNIKEYRQFIGIAKGSSAELETQLLLVHDLYDIDIRKAHDLVIEVQKMLHSLRQKLEPNAFNL